MILDDIKVYLRIDYLDISKDDLLNLYIRKSTNIIKNYLKDESETIDTIQSKYADAVIDFSIFLLNKKSNIGIKQYTEGGQSVTYSTESNSIPDTVLSLLPKPCIHVGGY